MFARDRHEQNRRSWNQATEAHNSHKEDQARFLREGGSTLFPEERELLGDVRGKRLAHLQCNAGQDSLSLAALGAEVTGVDISDKAIECARRLSTESGTPARFERADVYDWLASTSAGGFDVAFSSYGALCWLSDLTEWARGVARALAPGGRLVLVEFYPSVYWVEEREGHLVLAPSHGGGGARYDFPDGIGDYVADSGVTLTPSGWRPGVSGFRNPEACYEWEWWVSDVVEALLAAGLRIETLREWPWSNGCRFFPSMVDLGARRWGWPEGAPRLPLMYGLGARRV